MVGRQGRGVALVPDGQGGNPGVDLQWLLALVRLVEQVAQWVEPGRQVAVFRARLTELT